MSFVCALMCLQHGLVCDLWYTSSTCLLFVRQFVFHIGWSVICGIIQVCVFCLCANVSSTWISLWSWLFLKYESFVCALICLPHGLVCDLWYNSSTVLVYAIMCLSHGLVCYLCYTSSMCLLFVRLCVFHMG